MNGVEAESNLEEPKNTEPSEIQSNGNMMQYTLINVVQLERRKVTTSLRCYPMRNSVISRGRFIFCRNRKIWGQVIAVRAQAQQKR
jgi:hypothetical protein